MRRRKRRKTYPRRGICQGGVTAAPSIMQVVYPKCQAVRTKYWADLEGVTPFKEKFCRVQIHGDHVHQNYCYNFYGIISYNDTW